MTWESKKMLSQNEKRILIIGASVLQLPAILRAKEMGFTVAVADYNPKAAGVSAADVYYNVSTIDEAGVTAAALEFRPDGIMTLATDMPMRAIAAACKACGLPGITYETAVRATDKAAMIRAFEEHGVAHPRYAVAECRERFDALADKVSFPCVIKPTDNAGSRGVALVRSREELAAAYEYSRGESRSGAVILEEYLRGPEFSVEVVVTEGTPHVLQITDKLTTGAPHFVEMGHSQPTAQPEDRQEMIRDLACRAVKAVGIDTGPAHVEMILTEDGPKMVELGARMGGDCIATHLVPLSTGIDIVAATIDLACGRQPDLTPRLRMGSAIRYFRTSAGILTALEGVEEARRLSGVREIVVLREPGDEITDIGSSVDRIGFVIAQAETARRAVEICELAISRIRIRVEPAN